MAKRSTSADINRPLAVTITNAGAAGGGIGGGGTLPGTLTGDTGNTVVGDRHYHNVQLAHSALLGIAADDHHDPVTVGNTGLSLSTQQVSLNLAATSGLQISSGLMLADSIAGDGLAISSKVLGIDLATNSGLQLSGSPAKLLLRTPSTLDVSSANTVTDVLGHTHAITSSANPGAAASILASDASGHLQLERIGLARAPLYPLHVAGATQQVRVDYNDSNYLSLTVGSDGAATLATAGASGNLNLNPVGDVVFDPTGNDLLPATGYDLNIGTPQKKYLTLHAAELWVETLVAQETIATIGGRILVGPTTTLVTDLSDTFDHITVKHNDLAYWDRVYLEAAGKVEFIGISGFPIVAIWPGENGRFKIAGNFASFFPAGQYFTVRDSTGNDGEWVSASATFDGTNTNITVTGTIPSDTADGHIAYRGQQGGGAYSYYVARNLDGSGGNAWYAGDAVFNTGVTGEGFIDLYSLHGVKSATQYGPTIVGNVRNSVTYNDWSEHWAIGNLNGIYGYSSTTFGAAFGRYANDSSYLTADATNGIRILKRASSTNTTLAQWAMNGVITIGEVAASRNNVYIASGALSLRNNTTERIGLTAAGVLTIKDSGGNAVITLDASAGAEITKKLTMPGANSAIAIGATPPTANNSGTGIWIDRTGMYGLASNVLQTKFDATTGKLMAGGGSHILDKDGFTIREAGDTYLYRYYDINDHLVSDDYVLIDESTPPAKYIYRDIIVNDDYYTVGGFRFLVNRDGASRVKLELNTFSPSRLTLNADVFAIFGGALNVGKTGIYGSAGDIYASGGLNLGTATGAGAGDIKGSGELVMSGTGDSSFAGDVGIGVTAPGTTLDVFGSVRATRGAAGVNAQYIELGEGDAYSNYLRSVSPEASQKSLVIRNLAASGTPTVSNKISFQLGTLASPSEKMAIDKDGNVWILADCSAASFTDRTPYPDRETALAAILSMRRRGEGLDHKALHEYLRAAGGRNLSATVSAQNVIIQELLERVEQLERPAA